MHRVNVKRLIVKKVLIWLTLGVFWGGVTLAPAAPALAQAGAPPVMEKPVAPAAAPAPEAAAPAPEGAPTTCGPMISDTCLPIETGKFAMQVWWALSLVNKAYSLNWQRVSAGGNFRTFFMPVKFTYGPTKDLEIYAVVPFIHNWVNDVNVPAPDNSTSAGFSGIGDITTVAKYNVIPEGTYLPAVSAVAGVGWPTGHASRLNPNFLGQDAIGTGSFNFITGVNLFKYLQPVLIHAQIWMNTPANLYKLNSDPFRNVRSREYLTVNLAAELPITKKWVLLFEVYSNWTWQNLTQPGTGAALIQGYQTPQTVLGILPGIEFLATDKLALAAGASLDLVGKNGVQKFTPMLTAFYTF